VAGFRRLYRGAFYEIWVATQSGGCQVVEYVQGLDERSRKRLRAIVTKTAREGKYTSIEIYREIGDRIFEFKYKTCRVYSFDDDDRIILTHGGAKPKSVNRDRAVAVDVRAQYYEWKGQQKS
jgi:hypothetical protein